MDYEEKISALKEDYEEKISVLRKNNEDIINSLKTTHNNKLSIKDDKIKAVSEELVELKAWLKKYVVYFIIDS